MHHTCHPSGSAPLGSSLRSFRWFLALAAALAGLVVWGNTVTYSITGSDGTHRLDATFTVDDAAAYNDQWGYRTYYNVPGGTPRAVKAGSFTITAIATGQVVEQGVADTNQWSYFHVLDFYGNTDWLIFVIYTATGPIEIDVFWDNLDAFAGFAAPTSFAVQATRLYAWTPTFRNYLESVAISHVDCTQLLGQVAALKRELADAQAQTAALGLKLTAAQTSLDRFVSAFRGTFNHPTFQLAGADTNARLNALIDGILGINRGSQQQLYFQLTGKK